jgi:hypothetical protein
MDVPGKSPTSIGNALCEFCQNAIPFLDLREGRAAVISGKTCCAQCANDGAWIKAASVPLPEGVFRRRASPRFIPSNQCELDLRPRGWQGWFSRNLNLKWLDVSQGGLRAVVRGTWEVDHRLAARIFHQPTNTTHQLTVRVRHVQVASEFPDAVVMGVEFETPPPALQNMLRSVHNPRGS